MVYVVEKVFFYIWLGEILGLVGELGLGKSIIGCVILWCVFVVVGCIVFRGEDIM